MAAAKEQLEIELLAKDLATKVLRRFGAGAAREGRKAEKAFTKTGGVISKLNSKLVVLAAQFIGVGIAIQGIRKGVRSFLDFSKAMGEVNTILDTTQFTLEGVEKDILNLSLALGEQETLIAKGFYQTLSAGVTDAADAMLVLDTAAKLGIAGLSSTEAAVDILTTVINAYGLSVEDAVDISDTLFKTVELGKTRIPELAAAMGSVIPVAAELGVDLVQVSSTLATMTKQGASTSEAVTRLGSIFQFLQKQGPLVREAFASIGKNWDENTLQSQGLTQTLLDLREAFEGDRESLIQLLGRKEAINGFFALTKDGAEVLTQTLKEMENRLGSTEEAFQKQLITPAREFEILVGGVRLGLLELGRVLITTFTGSAKEFGTIEEAAEGLRDAIVSMAPALRVSLGLLSALGLNAILVAEAMNVANAILMNIDVATFEANKKALNESLVIATEVTRNLLTGDNDFTQSKLINARKRRQAIADEKVEISKLIEQTQKITAAFGRRKDLGLVFSQESAEALQARFDEIQSRLAEVGVDFDEAFTIGRVKVDGLKQALRELGIVVDEVSELPPLDIVGKPDKPPMEELDGFVESFRTRIDEIRATINSESLGQAAADGLFFSLSRGFDKLNNDIVEGKANFKDFADQILKDLARVILKLIELKIIKIVLSGFGLAEGGVTPPIEDQLARGGVRGGMSGHLPLRKFARGGIATTPQLAVFGEGNSPGGEAFVPLGGDRKIPVKFPEGGPGGGGAVTVQLNVQSLDPRTAGDVILAQGDLITNMIASALAGNKNRSLVNAVRSTR